MQVLHVPLAESSIAGRLDPVNARYVLTMLDRAVEGCRRGEFSAMVTAPVHKGVINDAGIAFTGHTEYLAQLTNSEAVMLLVGGGMRVALATTHLPLKDVPAAITRDTLEQKLRIIHTDLINRFAIARPRIAVAGLNPHAGESGHLGKEEIETIIPALEGLRAQGMDLVGPLPADTLFHPPKLKNFDCVFAMYHDQGLPVLKHASFGNAVNVTLGLPIIRTSVDHGTALDLAGTGRADPGSLLAAIEMAATLAGQSKNRALTSPTADCAASRLPTSHKSDATYSPQTLWPKFLDRPSGVAEIVSAIHPSKDDLLVEIGPGMGALTRPLLQVVVTCTWWKLTGISSTACAANSRGTT